MSDTTIPLHAERALDKALHAALPPPQLPGTFHTQLMALVRVQSLNDMERRRQMLEEEHLRTLGVMRAGHVQLQRNTLALIVVIAFTAGACANLILPWLSSITGASGAVMVPLLALAIGMGTGFRVWWDRLGPYR